MNIFKKLFSGKPSPQQLSGHKPCLVEPSQFATAAETGPAKCKVSILQIPQIMNELLPKFQHLGSGTELADFYSNSLIGVCPKCNEYCAAKALTMMDFYMNANTMFTGNSGGFERFLEGKCLTYSCNSSEYDLFWCPDLSPELLSELKKRGINIDPDIQRTRDHLWKPATNINEQKIEISEFPMKMLGKVTMVIINYEGEKNKDFQDIIVQFLRPLIRNGGGFVFYCNTTILPLANGEPSCAMINVTSGFPEGLSLESYMAFLASKDSFPPGSPAYGRDFSFEQIGYWVGKKQGRKVHAILLF
jgi:hypothetical protein